MVHMNDEPTGFEPMLGPLSTDIGPVPRYLKKWWLLSLGTLCSHGAGDPYATACDWSRVAQRPWAAC